VLADDGHKCPEFVALEMQFLSVLCQFLNSPRSGLGPGRMEPRHISIVRDYSRQLRPVLGRSRNIVHVFIEPRLTLVRIFDGADGCYSVERPSHCASDATRAKEHRKGHATSQRVERCCMGGDRGELWKMA